MSVRFKFRSSVAFDSADLGGRTSISVRDLRAKIVEQKNLQICRDFDLVISDADTGGAFDDEGFHIPAGSSVIIKRVPAGRPSDIATAVVAVRSSEDKHTGLFDALPSSPSENLDSEKFDDFGTDFYPTFEASLPESDADMDDMNILSNRKDKFFSRCSETSNSKCHNFERSDISEAMSKDTGENCKKECDNEEKKNQAKLDPNKEENKKLDEVISMLSPTTMNIDSPLDLRCSLCNKIFKDAVMIPCCQHSFCDKCIRLALVDKARCPKCSSEKCTVNNLLPNLSLRHAIEHLLEAQVAINGTDNTIPKIIPDRESGIQAKEISCAVSVRQQEPPFPHSPSVTGKGSNQVMMESAYASRRAAGTGSRLIRLDADKSVKSSPSLLKIKQFNGNKNSSAEALKQMADFQAGGNSSKLPQDLLQKEEATLAIQKRKGSGVNPSDGNGVPLPPFKHRKGDRCCYMCGSPNHFIRDCPAASNSYTGLQTGESVFPGGMAPYGQPYWHGPTFPHVRPYGNMYATPGMMPFDPTIVPVTPFGIPSYMPSMYGGMPVPYGYMRMGNIQPSVMAERPFSRAEFMDIQDDGRKHELLNEYPDRVDYDNSSEEYRYTGTRRRSHEQGTTRSWSDDDSQRILKKILHERHYSPSRERLGSASDEEIHSVERKHEKKAHLSVSARDQRTYHSEKSNSGVSNSSDRHSKERKKHHHTSSSKKHSKRRGHYGSDCSRKSHHVHKEKFNDTEKVMKDHKRNSSKHQSHSESGWEPYSCSERKRLSKENDPCQSSRHSIQKVTSTDDQLEDDRWEMVDGSAEDYREAYHYRIRKRTH